RLSDQEVPTMNSIRTRRTFIALVAGTLLFSGAWAAARPAADQPSRPMAKRWLFFWRNMSDPREVDRVLAKLPRAQADGYNGVVVGDNVARIPAAKAAELRAAAKAHGIDVIAVVMGGFRDRNYAEGVLAQDTLFVAHGGTATHQPDGS